MLTTDQPELVMYDWRNGRWAQVQKGDMRGPSYFTDKFKGRIIGRRSVGKSECSENMEGYDLGKSA